MHGDFDSIFCVHTYEYNLKENDVIMMYMTSLHVQHILWYLFMHSLLLYTMFMYMRTVTWDNKGL